MNKITMTTPLVEMDGDEMTRILWQKIKEELLLPFVDLKTEYYDLGLPERDRNRRIRLRLTPQMPSSSTASASSAPPSRPTRSAWTEYKLHEMWKSPNGTIRAMLDGTVFRTPILIESIHPAVRNWKKPITIARHAYGDVYRNTEIRIRKRASACELVFTGRSGQVIRREIS